MVTGIPLSYKEAVWMWKKLTFKILSSSLKNLATSARYHPHGVSLFFFLKIIFGKQI